MHLHRLKSPSLYRPLICLCVFLHACSGDMQDLEQYVENTRNKYQGSVEPLPQIDVYKNYVYNAFSMRDPFQSVSNEQIPDNGTGLRPDTGRRKEPLEYFPMDSLQMVGIISQKGQTWGLIRDPDGTIHRVQPGNHVGENFGEITRVQEDKISLLEIIPDGLGGWVEREVTLTTGAEE